MVDLFISAYRNPTDMKGISKILHIQSCMVLLLLNGVRSITLADRYYTLTFHDYKKTWNEALAICETFNGSLLKLDSPERTNVLDAFIPTWPKDHVWIGLHYPSTESNDRYGWLDCLLSDYTNWYTDEPKQASTERCSYRNKDHGQWKSHGCDSTKKFVCQIDNGPCTFIPDNGMPDPSSEYEVVAFLEDNADSCLNRCLTMIHNNTNCWAVNFNGTSCLLYFTSLPFLFTSLNRSADSIDFFTKDCFNSSIDSIDDTSVTVTNGPEPNTDCTIFTNQSTTATTSSTSSTSTTMSSTPSTTTQTTLTPTTTSSTPNTTTQTTVTHTTTSSTPSTTTQTTLTPTTTSSTPNTTTQTTLTPTTMSSTPNTTTQTTLTPTTMSSTPSTTTQTTLTPTTTSLTPSTTTQTTLTPTTTFTATFNITNTTSATITTSSSRTETAVSSSSISSLNTSKSSVGTTTTSSLEATTSNHSSESPTIEISADNSTCFCSCLTVSSLESNLTLPQKLDLIRLKLTLDFRSLSSNKRKKTSASDERTSAKSVGYVAVVFVCLELSMLLVMDFTKFYFKT